MSVALLSTDTTRWSWHHTTRLLRRKLFRWMPKMIGGEKTPKSVAGTSLHRIRWRRKTFTNSQQSVAVIWKNGHSSRQTSSPLKLPRRNPSARRTKLIVGRSVSEMSQTRRSTRTRQLAIPTVRCQKNHGRWGQEGQLIVILQPWSEAMTGLERFHHRPCKAACAVRRSTPNNSISVRTKKNDDSTFVQLSTRATDFTSPLERLSLLETFKPN